MVENVNTPLISVITCVYNGESYVAQAIQSVLEQTFTNWELIVVDDGSTDNTASVVSQFLTDNRVKYYYQPNGKQGKARNFGIAKAVSPWLAFIDADDIWMPDKLYIQHNLIYEFGDDVDVFFSSAEIFHESSFATSELHCENGFIEHKSLFVKLLSGENKILFSSVVMKKSSFMETGGFDETPFIAEDYHLWLRMCDAGYRFFGIDEILVKYRVHNNQTSHSDFHAFILSVKAFILVKFTTISNQKEFLKRRLDRFLLHNIDHLTPEQINELLHLYLKPLNRMGQFWISKILLFLGIGSFKRYAYNYFDL